jgi:hypothetical protein
VARSRHIMAFQRKAGLKALLDKAWPSAVHCTHIPYWEFDIGYERVLAHFSGLLEIILPRY